MIQNIVLDMGNVLREFAPQKIMDNLQIGQRDAELIDQHLFKSHLWYQYDLGTLSLDQVVQRVSALLPGLKAQIKQCAIDGNALLVPIEGMYELVQELKQKGYGLYVLSNASYDMLLYVDQLPVMEMIDGIVISAQIQCAKPNAQIYRHFCKQFNLDPKTCFFVDDNAANVQGAIAVGMPGHTFVNTQDLRKRLQQEGIL